MPITLQRTVGSVFSALLVLGTLVVFAAPAQGRIAPAARAAIAAKQGPEAQHEEFDVLVFSKTAGYRHASIPDGIAAIKELGAQHHFGVDATEDAGAFTDENLEQYEAVIWLSTTGNVLNEAQQAAFERYIKGGGGYVGIHAAADTEYDWPFYGKLTGAYFESHPSIQEATVKVTDRVHPSTKSLPKSWTRTDEWYNYATNPRGDVHVLAALDESTYDGGAMGADHPISWCQLHQGGRAWYTGMGHTTASYGDQKFREHMLGGIRTASGAVNADCGATNWSNFDQVTLAQGPDEVGEPMGMAVLPDGGVLHSERQGTLSYTTAAGETSVAADIPVYTHDEEGLQSIAIDPNFAQNRWVYVYYAPPLNTPSGDAPESAQDPAVFEKWQGHNQLSRFKFTDGKLDMASEQQIMRVDATRGMCCHVGGDIAFGPKGNLYLSTGDDSNPFQSSGYTPIDERGNRNPAFDAQRTSANTNDLRGKVLRITMQADGSYSIPDGNMFSGDSSDKTRGEIYAMGFRNPYRISVDQKTGAVYVGNYGPDAATADPQRGPAGIVEFDRITEPGFYGWPYCVGKNKAYHSYDFATGESGPAFDCANPVNESPNNDGLTQLPPAKPAWLPYNDGSVPEFGSGSESPMGGPVYRHDADSTSTTKLPAHYSGKFFAYEWGRGWIKTISMGENGQPAEIDPFFPSMTLTRPMDIEFGPNGSLYVLDYGSGYFGGAEDSALYRIDYVKGDRAPNAEVSAEPTSGQAPLKVSFSAKGSGDPDPGSSITYAWDFDGDGRTDATEPNPTHTYTGNGEHTATLTVTDETGKTGTATEAIVVGNTAPTLTFQQPGNGRVFSFGDTVPYKVSVSDPDGTKVDCSKVQVEYILGHSTGNDAHGHPLSQATGCEGTIETANTDGHQGADIYGVLHAEYTDSSPSGKAPALTGEAEITLQPATKQAEFFGDSNGVQIVEDDAGAQAGARVGYIESGDWLSFRPYHLAGVTSMSFRVSSGGNGGTIEVRSGAPDGPLVATAEVSNTGGWTNYADTGPVPVTDPGGTNKLFLVFRGSGSGGLFDVDSFTFHGAGEPPQTCEPTQPEKGYTSLFNGTADSRQNWSQAGPGRFEHTENCTLRSVGGMGLHWYSAEKFQAPYSLKLDWKKPGDDNSGIFVGSPNPGNDPWVAVEKGEEIQIDPTDDPANRTGAVYDEQAPDQEKVQQALKSDGEWNTYEIIVTKKAITVFLNGTKVNHWVDDDPNVDLTQGYIGLQNHGDSDNVSFRNVRIDTTIDVVAPAVSAQLDPAKPNGDPYGKYEGTYNSPVTTSLSAEDGDGSGVDSVAYKLDDGPWKAYTEPLTVETAGQHTVTYRATDKAGNTSKAAKVGFEIMPDACPGSDLRKTVIIGDEDTGVSNVDTGDGCTVNDLIDENATYSNHGAFVDHVDQLTDTLVADGVLTGKEKGRIMRAAGRSDIGK
ncbi:ThuA domain-containing protein [Haloactinomyces albus]|uniref:Glucose/arabinose dehydrogenase/PKD repeat protein/type 1 glutamine amidotransferase n=1 Tax=Haloactinomyces albus TaxID=1352928 RepID=A0AAE4CQJ2_9ACTN|nr:ThuA domain-containing protein [Haloactinomyces albus]MDR7304182.1 glucose/arabinose dehydrogenase/PKD repeat protein/type 1 glutamine amidotransferase [Haloactinomyces albus]